MQYKNKKMNIVFASDNNFSAQLAVIIISILRNSEQNEEFQFYVLDGGITNKNKEKINTLKNFKNFQIEYIKMTDSDFKDCPLNSHFKIQTYYRIKIPTLLNNIEKVLYLDCDTIVKKPLYDFYKTNLGDKYAKVVEDFSSYIDFINKLKESLGTKKYFNAGIMLLNLKKMREDNIEQKCFDFIKNSPEKIKYVDQDVLNKVFEDNVIFDDEKWNFQFNLGVKNIKSRYKQTKQKIAILHFACKEKPWQLEKFHTCAFEWYYYLFMTSFKTTLIKEIINFFKSILNILKKVYKRIKTLIKMLLYSN